MQASPLVKGVPMRWTHQSLLKARGVVFVAAGVAVLVLYIVSRLRGM